MLCGVIFSRNANVQLRYFRARHSFATRGENFEREVNTSLSSLLLVGQRKAWCVPKEWNLPSLSRVQMLLKHSKTHSSVHQVLWQEKQNINRYLLALLTQPSKAGGRGLVATTLSQASDSAKRQRECSSSDRSQFQRWMWFFFFLVQHPPEVVLDLSRQSDSPDSHRLPLTSV